MHQVVAYDGIVLGKRPVREADLLVFVFTPQGLLRAKATSARAEKSKLRYGLEPLTRGRYSFVQGKREWKLTGVEALSRSYLAAGLEQRQAIARVGRLLLRLIHGQEPSAELYKTVTEGFDALARPHHARENSLVEAEGRPEDFFTGYGAAERINSIEVVLVLRILSNLGYLPHTDALTPFVDGGFTVELSAKALAARALLVRTINESLQATGL